MPSENEAPALPRNSRRLCADGFVFASSIDVASRVTEPLPVSVALLYQRSSPGSALNSVIDDRVRLAFGNTVDTVSSLRCCFRDEPSESDPQSSRRLMEKFESIVRFSSRGSNEFCRTNADDVL